MKSPRLAWAVVAVCLPGLVAFVSAMQAPVRGPFRPSHPAARSVEIRHREGAQYLQSTALPAVTEVRGVLDRALALAGPRADACVCTRAALEQRFGERMTQVSAAPGYFWYWDGERWIIICTSTSTFAVDFGPYGTVEVEARDWTEVP